MTNKSDAQDPADQIAALARALDRMFLQWAQGERDIAAYWKVHRKGVANTFKAIYRTVVNFPTDVQENSAKLANRGWYIDPELPFAAIRAAALDIAQGNSNEVDQYFAKHYSDRLPEIRDTLVAMYPVRRVPLEQAFLAHQNGQYALSVPVFFSQAEGISIDEIGGKLFQKKNGRPIVAAAIEAKVKSEASNTFLSVLGLPGGVTATEEFRARYPDCPNRHEVLHGIDSKYGSEINSLKAISLLTFVGILSRRLLLAEVSDVG